MPTYLNGGTSRGNYGMLSLEPGQSGTSNEFIPTSLLPTGWTQSSASPSYNPIISSQVVTSTGSYTIPDSLLGNYQITFFCAAGSAVLTFNGTGNTKAIVAGEKYSIACSTRIISLIGWTISSCTMSVTVEKI